MQTMVTNSQLNLRAFSNIPGGALYQAELQGVENGMAANRTRVINAWNDFLTLGIYQRIGNNATIQSLSSAMTQLASGKYSLASGDPQQAYNIYSTISSAATAYAGLINRLP